MFLIHSSSHLNNFHNTCSHQPKVQFHTHPIHHPSMIHHMKHHILTHIFLTHLPYYLSIHLHNNHHLGVQISHIHTLYCHSNCLHNIHHLFISSFRIPLYGCLYIRLNKKLQSWMYIQYPCKFQPRIVGINYLHLQESTCHPPQLQRILSLLNFFLNHYYHFNLKVLDLLTEHFTMLNRVLFNARLLCNYYTQCPF